MFFVLVVSFWAIQVLQHDKFLEMAENNHQRAMPLRAPRGVMFDRHGKVLVENREALQHLARPRAGAATSIARCGCWRAVTGVEERYVREAVDRSRALPRYRPIRVVADADDAADRLGGGAPARAARRPRRARADPRVSARLGRAPVRLRRRDHRHAAGAARPSSGSRRGARSARPASSRPTTSC